MNISFPLVPLNEIISPVERPEVPITGIAYRQVGVRLWGQGAYERETIDGGQTQYTTLNRVELNDIIVNKIWARNGSVSIIRSETVGCYASGEFPLFVPRTDRLDPNWFYYLTRTPYFWKQCEEKSHGTSGKNRIRPERFLQIEIPLPPLEEQQRIVARIDALASRIAEARTQVTEIDQGMDRLLSSIYHALIEGAPVLPMNQVAPLVRRPVDIVPDATYHEIGIRSFGKGTFHKAPITGLEIGTKRVFQIAPGDLLFSNVFAWEGAIAVARPNDEGRIGSHRFITCVPLPQVATSSFLCFHFLTEHGLRDIGEASPGGAGRNRTLNLSKLEKIQVPIPALDKQRWFGEILSSVAHLRSAQAESAAEFDALLPSILDQAFKGEL